MQDAVNDQLAARFERYDAVATHLQKYFDIEDFGRRLDGKAEIQMVQEVQRTQVNIQDMDEVRAAMREYDEKLKHISVFASELANVLLPEKLSSKFENQDDLNGSIRQRGELIQQGKLITNWIMRTSNPK